LDYIKRTLYRWLAELKEIVEGSVVEGVEVENPEPYHFIMNLTMVIIF
jgi:hypothetical protein